MKMPNHPPLCPITGLEAVMYKATDEHFPGLRYKIPSVSGNLVVSITENVLQNTESRNSLIEHRDKFIKNLRMIAELREETVISIGNWWLFLR